MDKNSIIGFSLMGIVFIAFFYLNKPTEAQLAAQKHYQDSIAQVQKTQVAKGDTAVAQSVRKTDHSSQNFLKETTIDTTLQTLPVKVDTIIKEKVVTLENADVKIDISTVGGQMISAQLKNHKRFDGQPLFLFNKDADFGITLKNKTGESLLTSRQQFDPIFSTDKKVLTMRHAFSPTQYIDFVYTLLPNHSMLKFDVNMVGMTEVLSSDNSQFLQVKWSQKLLRQEKGASFEKTYATINYKYVGGDVDHVADTKGENTEIADPLKWIAFKDQYFATAIISDGNLSNSSVSSRIIENDEKHLKEYSATFFAPVVLNGKNLTSGFRFYLGPVEFSKLKKLDAEIKDKDQQLDLAKLVPLGWTLFRWVNQYFVIPLFALLSSWGLSMGIIILLMTIIVKLLLAPFTYKSYMSSAKMRVLRPQVQTINEKYPKQDQMMDRQKATMELYRRAGVNPMSGCLPMLLQMPVLLALFSFFPSAIELRQHSFLWAKDLSSYDAIAQWSGNIPFVTSWFGNHVSLFCLLMTIVNIIYMKFSMDQQDSGQQQMPGMKLMMYFMPVIMLFFLNNYPSGLTYYYFISTLITILLTLGFRYLVDENKVLAKLEANKKKVKKKSGFMARLEEAQRMQQQRARERAKGNKKR